MNTKFQLLSIAVSSALLAAPIQADPPKNNGGNHAPAARPAPAANAGSYRGGPLQNYGVARSYSAGPRFSPMGPSFRGGPIQSYNGARTFPAGQRFSSMTMPDPAWRQRFAASNSQNRFNSRPQSQLTPSTVRRQPVQGSNFQSGFKPGTTTVRSNSDRTISGTRAGTFQNDRHTQFGSVNPTSSTAQNQVFARRSANWQSTWDRNCDHWWNGHRCRFINNSWVIFDLGFYPWWPIGYPYDYYYGYDYGYSPYGYNYDPYAYGYGYGYDPGYNGDGGSYYGNGGDYGQGYVSPDQSGDPDSPVAAAQERLAREGYYHGKIDGVFGPETQQAVMSFQRDHGLNPTGYLTRDTRAALGLERQSR